MNKSDALISKVTQLLTSLRYYFSSAAEKKNVVAGDIADVILASDALFSSDDLLVQVNAAVLRRLEASGKPEDVAKADKLRLTISGALAKGGA